MARQLTIKRCLNVAKTEGLCANVFHPSTERDEQSSFWWPSLLHFVGGLACIIRFPNGEFKLDYLAREFSEDTPLRLDVAAFFV
jgi:hypothetical protein